MMSVSAVVATISMIAMVMVSSIVMTISMSITITVAIAVMTIATITTIVMITWRGFQVFDNLQFCVLIILRHLYILSMLAL